MITKVNLHTACSVGGGNRTGIEFLPYGIPRCEPPLEDSTGPKDHLTREFLARPVKCITYFTGINPV